VVQGDRKQGLLSIHHTLSLPLFLPHTLPLPQRGSFPQVQSLRNRLFQRGSPAGSQVLPANLLRRGLSTGSQPPLGIPLLHHGVIHEVQVEICSTVDLHGCRDSLPHHSLLHGCRGTSAPAPAASLPPPSALTIGSAGLFLSHSLTPLSCCKNCHYAEVFSTLSHYYRGTTRVAVGFGLGQQQVHLGAGWHWLHQTGGSFWKLLTETSAVAPPLPKPCHANPVQWQFTQEGQRTLPDIGLLTALLTAGLVHSPKGHLS